jgi:hypothetical protein
MNKNDKKENAKQIDCDLAIGDSITKIEAGTVKMEQPREGPFDVIRVHANGTVTMQTGPVGERLNTRQMIPCAEQTRQLI